MPRKDRIDGFGAATLVVFSLVLAVNQIAIKLSNEGFQPVFSAGLRSLLAVGFVWLGARAVGRRLFHHHGSFLVQIDQPQPQRHPFGHLQRARRLVDHAVA